MALNVASTQIYAGRFHYKKQELPNLLEASKNAEDADIFFGTYAGITDTVTLSEEGLAKAKDWREYTKEDPRISHVSAQDRIDELNRQMNTVNAIDTVSMFQCELGEVASEIRLGNQLGEHSHSQEEMLTVMAKAYQIIYDRIEEDFADPNRDTTWLLTEDGTYVEETKQDRIDALHKAYENRAEMAAGSAKSMAEIEKIFKGANYTEDFMTELQNKVKQSWMNSVSEKNLERLHQKVASFKEYSLDFGVEAKWMRDINWILYHR